MRPSRRAFLATTALGAALLAGGGLVRGAACTASASTGALDGEALRIVAALVPAFLDGALPDEPAERASALRETSSGVQTAVAGLPPAAQAELRQLFALLGFGPFRVLVAGVWPEWGQARVADTQAMLARWQSSRIALLRAAHDALHQLVLAAWYGNPRAWPAIGYPGPPAVAAAS